MGARTEGRAFHMWQFHWLFYCSRTLPNTFASLLVVIATAEWLDGRSHSVVRILTIAIVIFRAEIVLLIIPARARRYEPSRTAPAYSSR